MTRPKDWAKSAASIPLDLAHLVGLLSPERAHAGQLVVLTFHRVLPEELRRSYPHPGLAITPDELSQVLDVVCARYVVGTMSESYARLTGGALGDRAALALTFDDGQHDNLAYAADVLEKHGVRATFYIPTQAIEEQRLLWHDRLGFAATALGAREPAALVDACTAAGLAEVAHDPEALAEAVKKKTPAEREALIRALEAHAGPPPAWARMMTWEDVRALAERGHEIGSHAVTHTPLVQLSEPEIEAELRTSRETLEKRVGAVIPSLCYPNGDADDRCVRAARAAGYTHAVTTRFGVNTREHEPYLLKRLDVDARRVRGARGVSPGLLALRISGRDPRARHVTDDAARAGSGDIARGASLGAIAYFTSEYPARSHTFIRREIAALRALGVAIAPFSIRKSQQLLDGLDRAAHEETTSILPAPPLRLLRAHARRAVRAPVAYVRSAADAVTHRLPGARNLLWSMFHFAEAMQLADDLERRGVRHLHCQFANAGANVARLAARHLGITYSMTLHGTSDFEFPAGPLLPQKLEECLFAVCISHFGRAQAMRTLPPKDWRKLFVVRCGVESSALGVRTPRDDGRVRVIGVGRLSSEKGHLGLIEAFAAAARRDPRLELVLVGDGPLRAQIEAAVAHSGVGDRVTLRGALAERDTLTEIARADLLALPSFMEGIPLVLMEAMAVGVPVVAPRVAGIPELVEHDVSGLLYTPALWDELADAIVQLAADPARRDRLGARGRERVAEEFVVERSAEQLEHIFREQLGGR